MTKRDFNEDLARLITANMGEGYHGEIRTRMGLKVRIVCWNAKGPKPIVGLVETVDGESPRLYTRDGKHDQRPNVKTNYDLELFTDGHE